MDTGYLNPVSAFTVSAGLGGTRPWVSAGNTGSLFSAARASDNVRVMIDDISAAVVPFPFFTQFSPAIPANSEVQGFSVRYERRANSTAVSANETWIMLTSGAGAGVQRLGTTANANVANLTATEAYFSAGGSGSMFGLTTADASAGRINGRFGVAIQIRYGTGTTLTSAIAQIDHVQLQVHYTPPTVSAEPYSAEFDREHFSVAISPVIRGQSAEFEHEVYSLGITRNLVPQAAEFDYELRPVDIVPVSALSPEMGYEVGQVALAANLSPIGAEWDYQAGQIDLEQTVPSLGVQSTEFDRESGAVGLVLNVAAQSAEWDLEAGSVLISTNIQASTGEWEREHANAGLLQLHELGVLGAEHDRGHSNAALATNVVGQSSEHDFEVANVAIATNIVVAAQERDFEAASVSLGGPVEQAVDEAEFGLEITSVQVVGPGANLAVDEAEFGFETTPPFLVSNLAPFAGEWEREIADSSLVLNMRPDRSGYEREMGSLALAQNYGVGGFESDYEAGSPGLTSVASIQPNSMEFDWEWAEFPLAVARRRRYWRRTLEGRTGKREQVVRRLVGWE